MKNLKYVALAIVCLSWLTTSSCRKFVEIDGPRNQVTTDLVFSDSTNANAAITGIYYQIAAAGNFGLLSGGLTLYAGLSADELAYTATDATITAFYSNNILPGSDRNTQLYLLGFKYIYAANACVEGIGSSAIISSSAKNRLIAEARFLRAFTYFHLVNIYGAVPMVTGTDYNSNRLLQRSQPDALYALIISDLKFAQQNLSPELTGKDRANYYAATALLARTLLYTGQYADAAREADKVIASGKFNLETNLANVFLSTSNETIWNTLSVIPLQATYDALNFVPTSATARPRYILTPALFSSFEAGDLRKANWTRVNTNAGTQYPYPFKYRIRSTTGTAGENLVVIRLGELYLIRAEARASTGDIEGAKADLNVIRKRAGLPNTGASDKAGLLLAIEHERRSELFCEWGQRWFDLKRTNRALSILSSLKPGLSATGLLYPIPVRELNSNPNMSQNPGY